VGALRVLPVLAALAALAGCAHSPSDLAGAHYVAMGSSFAAGSGIDPPKADAPKRCGRSERNYATLLSAKLNLSLTDVSCGGATTAHILGPWSELPAQIEAVTPATRLVTVTIGGNDIGYVTNLFAATCVPGDGIMAQGNKIPCFKAKPPTEEAYARAEANLVEIGRQVAARAPLARLVFVQYVTLVPDAPCETARMDGAAMAANREIGRRLADLTVRAANQTGALVLPMDQLSRGHTTCDAVSWSHGIGPGLAPGDGSPWHPTGAGMRAIAVELEKLLTS
jgi:lysophospholipase L1-like esterase